MKIFSALGNNAGCALLPFLFYIIGEILASALSSSFPPTTTKYKHSDWKGKVISGLLKEMTEVIPTFAHKCRGLRRAKQFGK